MKLQSPMLVVTDMERSLAFYGQVLGLAVELDFGANKTLTGGLVLQTEETFCRFIGVDAIHYGGNDAELYFEEEDFDGFVDKLKACQVELVHPAVEHAWGQRVVRLYDPDRHILEVAEPIRSVCLRFLSSGMTAEQVAKRMDVPLAFVQDCM